ncbi:MAG: DHA2 family efflux MFS transporter permease subunit [Clostridiales bacterium]|nr:DHA2 family efflux MFS transporter permease subunit [Clostridiales bacterium]
MSNKPRSIVKPLFVIVLTSAMIQLGSISFNVLTPVLASEFSAPISTVQWVIVGYMLTLASVTPFAAWFSGRFGGRRVLLCCTALYGIMSLCAAWGANIHTLIAFRMLQGAVGAMTGPVGMAITYRLCDKDKVGRIMGIIGIPIFMTPAFGPMLAGWLADLGSWKTILYINLPIVVIILVTGFIWLPKDERSVSARPDIAGMALAPLAFISVIYGLQKVVSGGKINVGGIAVLLVGCAALYAFIKRELTCENPILRLDLFREKAFFRAVILQTLSVLLIPGFLFLLPLFFQNVNKWSAFTSGLIMLPISFASVAGMPLGGVTYDKRGVNRVVSIGFGSTVCGMLAFLAVSGLQSAPLIICAFCVVGFGLGFYATSLSTHVLSQAPKELTEDASAINSAVIQLFNAAAITVSTAILTLCSGFGAQRSYFYAFGITSLMSLCILGLGILLTTRNPTQ